jgi:hypothetical protein
MTVTKTKTGSTIRWRSAAEAQQDFEQAAQATLGISASEFVRRWRAREYEKPECDTPELVTLSMHLPRRPSPGLSKHADGAGKKRG